MMVKSNGDLDPYTDLTSIGNLAISKGWATREEVARALTRQEMRTPLGEILVEQGVLTAEQLEDLLFEQKMLRSAVRDSELTKQQLIHQKQKIKEVTESVSSLAIAMRTFVNRC